MESCFAITIHGVGAHRWVYLPTSSLIGMTESTVSWTPSLPSGKASASSISCSMKTVMARSRDRKRRKMTAQARPWGRMKPTLNMFKRIINKADLLHSSRILKAELKKRSPSTGFFRSRCLPRYLLCLIFRLSVFEEAKTDKNSYSSAEISLQVNFISLVITFHHTLKTLRRRSGLVNGAGYSTEAGSRLMIS